MYSLGKKKKIKNLQALSRCVRFDKWQALSDVLPCLGALCQSTGWVNVSSKMISRTWRDECTPGHSAPRCRGKGGCAGLEIRFGDQGWSQDKLRPLWMCTNTAAPWGILFGLYGPLKDCLGLWEAVKKIEGWTRRCWAVLWLGFAVCCAECLWRQRLPRSSFLVCSCLNFTVQRWSRDAWGRSEDCNVVMSKLSQVRRLSQCQEGSKLPFSFVPGLPIIHSIWNSSQYRTTTSHLNT